MSDIAVQDRFPFLTVELKADQDGIPIEITKENLLIQEVNYTNSPYSIEKTTRNSFIVQWSTNIKNQSSIAYFYLTYGNEVGYAELAYPVFGTLPILRTIQISNPAAGTQVLFFNSKPNGDPDTLGIYLENSTQKIVLDSVVFDIPNEFGYELLAPIGTKLPYELKGRLGFFIIFYGKEDRLYQNRITLYYNGGQSISSELVANKYRVQTKTSLTIIEPKPGDTLTPCISDTIKWIGGMPGATTYIEYSSNNGLTWDQIASTVDSFWVGVISNKPTEQGLVRIYQKFQSAKTFTLRNEKGYNRLKFSDDAEYLITSTNDARIIEMKVDQSAAQQNPQQVGENYVVADYSQPEESGGIVALAYTKYSKLSANREFAVVYSPAFGNSDSLFYFTNASDRPIMGNKLNYRVNQAETDPLYRWLAVLPKISNKIEFISTDTKKITFEFVAKAPIRRFAFTAGGDSLVLALQNNTIEVYDISTMLSSDRLLNTIDFGTKPLIDRISYSPDGRFLAFSTAFPPDDEPNRNYLLFASRTHVYELSSEIMINSYFGVNSEALGVNFNPSSSRLVRASKLPVHIVMYDLSFALDNDNFSVPDYEINTYDFATEGHNIGAISTNGVLYLHKFVYTEYDIIDGALSVVEPTIKVEPIVISERFIDTRLDTISTKNLCNVGDLPFIINKIEFKYGKNFSINYSTLPVRISPDECFDFGYVYNPIDTGIIHDTLMLYTCVDTFKIPFTSRGLARNIEFYTDEYNFGEVCLTQFKDKRVKLLRNLDPVPLHINRVYFASENNSGFYMLTNYFDTVYTVAPNEDYYADIRFIPQKRGTNSAKCLIQHSYQNYMVPQLDFIGIGLGSDVNLSHTQLRFIPEIPIRKFKIRNLENTPLTLVEYRLSTNNAYRVLSPELPITLNSQEEAEIEVECLTNEAIYSELILDAVPCLANAKIELNKYSGESIIQIEDVQADPRGSAIIKIMADSKEKNPYQGERFFEAELSINPNIFIADSENAIKSDYGIGKLLTQTVEDGKRIIKFRVDGALPMEGIIAEIHGLAGLTNPPTSVIELLPTSQLFGKNISAVTKPGIFKLINLCDDIFLYTQNTILTVKSIAPNPVKDMINLNIDSRLETKVNIDIYNNMGVLIKQTDIIAIEVGENTISIDSQSLSNGQYRAVIKGINIESAFSFIVLKY